MKTIDICHGEYASKWGLTDFYPESEAKLKEALASGEDFTTEWFGCKKEIRYATYTRENNTVYIAVACRMDDLYDGDDLIYDALYTGCRVEEELPDDIIDSIRDYAIDAGLSDETELSTTLPGDASFEAVVKATRDLEYQAEANNESMFSDLIDCVKAHWEYMHEEKED